MNQVQYKTRECSINMMLTELFTLLQDSDGNLPVGSLDKVINMKTNNGNNSKGIMEYATFNNYVVGMVLYHKPKANEEVIEIGMVAVAKRYRRMGIGSRLFLMAAKHIYDSGCDSVFLKCLTTNKSGINFYENLGGYIESTDTSVWSGGREHLIRFNTKTLTQK